LGAVEQLEERCLLSAQVAGAVGGQDVRGGDQRPAEFLPAVQKVDEAAARTQEVADLKNPSENAKIGLLLPAIQKVRDAAARVPGGEVTGPPNDDFVLPALQKVRDAVARAQNGFELPALQKVQEAAERLAGERGVTDSPNDSPAVSRIEDFVLPALQKVMEADEHAQNGFELPALQKVREAADRVAGEGDVTGPPNDDFVLPALQKVRDAADRTQEVADLKNPSENAQIGLLLPAVQKVRAR
jgi:hypothetical protein